YRLNGNTDQARAIGMLMVRIGERRLWFTYQGIGYMVCGDAYNHDYQFDLAWNALEKAGFLHKQAKTAGEPHADFNWASTLIGKWLCAYGDERISQVKRESEIDEEIFASSSNAAAIEKRLKLYNSAAAFLYEQCQQYVEALKYCTNILDAIQEYK